MWANKSNRHRFCKITNSNFRCFSNHKRLASKNCMWKTEISLTAAWDLLVFHFSHLIGVASTIQCSSIIIIHLSPSLSIRVCNPSFSLPHLNYTAGFKEEYQLNRTASKYLPSLLTLMQTIFSINNFSFQTVETHLIISGRVEIIKINGGSTTRPWIISQKIYLLLHSRLKSKSSKRFLTL
jgi:hypothetical protein